MKELLLNKKILIAGAGGLLGSHLVVRLIEQGASVIAADIDIDRTRTLLIDLGIESNIETIEFIKLDNWSSVLNRLVTKLPFYLPILWLNFWSHWYR